MTRSTVAVRLAEPACVRPDQHGRSAHRARPLIALGSVPVQAWRLFKPGHPVAGGALQFTDEPEVQTRHVTLLVQSHLTAALMWRLTAASTGAAVRDPIGHPDRATTWS